MGKQSAYNKKLDNALDYCIKLISTGATVEECLRLYPNLRRELRDLLSIVVNVKRAYPEYPELRPSKLYTKTGREKFLAMIEGGIPAIERELFKPKVSHTPTPFNLRELFRKYVGVGVAAAMLVVALGGLLYASGSSLPGSPLYGLKRTIEGFELAMTFDKEGKDRLLHEFSKRRMDEANLLAKLGKGKTAVLGYKISKNTTKDDINNLKLDDLTDKNNAANSGNTKPKTANKPRTTKKHKNRKSATIATTTTTTNQPPAVTPLAVNLRLPANEATVTSGELQFSWDDVSGATYSLRLESMDTTTSTSIPVYNTRNPYYKPDGNILTQLLGDGSGIKWKWCVEAVTNDGRTATSDYRSFSIIKGS